MIFVVVKLQQHWHVKRCSTMQGYFFPLKIYLSGCQHCQHNMSATICRQIDKMIHWLIPHFQTSVCKLNIIGPYMTQCLAAGIFWNVHRSWAESSSVVLKPGSVSTSLQPPSFPVSTFFLLTCQPARFDVYQYVWETSVFRSTPTNIFPEKIARAWCM